MSSTRGFEPLRPRNFADSSSRFTGKSAMPASSFDQTPNPKKTLLESFSKVGETEYPGNSENNDPLPDPSPLPISKITKSYLAASTYNSQQVQKLQKLLQIEQMNTVTALATATEVESLRIQLRAAIEEYNKAEEELREEEKINKELREKLAQTQASILSETEINNEIAKNIAKLKTKRTKIESSTEQTNIRSGRLKTMLSELESGQNSENQTYSELEADFRRQNRQKHSLEADLNEQKQTIQYLKQQLMIRKQSLSAAELAWGENETRRKAELSARQALESRWEAEFLSKRRTLDAVLLQGVDTWDSFEQNRDFCAEARATLAERKMSDRRVRTGIAFLCVLCFFLGLILRFLPRSLHSPTS
jgi:hypothetical protein